MYENNGYTNYEFIQQPAQEGSGCYPYANYTVPQEPKRDKKHGGRLKTAALILACSLLSGCVGAAAFSAVNGAYGNSSTLVESNRTPTKVQISYQSSDKLMTAAEVYAANVNSTVGITTSVTTTNFWGMKTSSAAAGSGFIISEDGYIVTNYHVVEKGSAVKVTAYDGQAYDAVLVGYDDSNDLAVLKINATGLKPVVLGSSESLHVGDEVIAIGNPLGELTFSLTKGSVSALNRDVTLSSNVTMRLIQTDAAINSGNSGGALFNMYGEVVGITNAKYSGSSFTNEASVDNIGFAIPTDNVKSVISSIIEKGYVSKPYIGVQVSDASDAALVYSVADNSPAAKAGLQANDIVTAANGEKIMSASDLTAFVKKLRVGDELKLTVSRSGQETILTVIVGEKQQDAKPQADEDQSGRGQYSDGSDSYNDFSDFFGGFPFGYSGGFSRG